MITSPVPVISQFTVSAQTGPLIGSYSTNCQIKIAIRSTEIEFIALRLIFLTRGNKRPTNYPVSPPKLGPRANHSFSKDIRGLSLTRFYFVIVGKL